MVRQDAARQRPQRRPHHAGAPGGPGHRPGATDRGAFALALLSAGAVGRRRPAGAEPGRLAAAHGPGEPGPYARTVLVRERTRSSGHPTPRHRLLRRRASGDPFPPLREGMAKLPPFLRDTDLNVRLRTFYFNRQNDDDTASEALGTRWMDPVRVGLAASTPSRSARRTTPPCRSTPPTTVPGACCSRPARTRSGSSARPGARSGTRSTPS